MTGHTEDTLLDGRVSLVQPARGFRAAIDSVLLAAAVPAEPGQSVLDAGCGSGAALFCLAARVDGLELAGLDMQPAMLALAATNAAANRAPARLVLGDVSRPPAELHPDSFEHVMTNPPFTAPGRGTAPADAGRAAAHMESADLAAWLQGCLRLLRAGGILTLVHRADRLGQILAVLDRRAGSAAILPLWPKPGMAAKRILVQARKGSRGALKLLPGLVLHRPDGSYTAEAQAILRDGAPLTLE